MYNSVLIFSLVLLIPYFFLFVWPLSVAGAKSGRSFCTDSAVNPGHVENYLFLIIFRSVFLGGVNADWWRYFISSALGVMTYALYAMCLVWTVFTSVDVLLHSWIVNIHNLIWGYCPPFHTSLILKYTLHMFSSYCNLHPESHRILIDIRYAWARPGTMWARFAFSIIPAIFRLHVCRP